MRPAAISGWARARLFCDRRLGYSLRRFRHRGGFGDYRCDRVFLRRSFGDLSIGRTGGNGDADGTVNVVGNISQYANAFVGEVFRNLSDNIFVASLFKIRTPNSFDVVFDF